uniref:Cleavage stimulation factor subunit 3 n=1 Tax=Romanomermis culicivorax TaxID=13658 RepID=A0A915J6H3_ROMCU
MAGVIAVITPERRIEKNVYDVEAWNLMLRDAQRRNIDQTRHFYEKLVGRFPNAGRFWKAYIEHEMIHLHMYKQQSIFHLYNSYIAKIGTNKVTCVILRHGQGLITKSVYVVIFLTSEQPNLVLCKLWTMKSQLKAKCLENVEKLFQRSLIKILNIDLWKTYLNYVRDTKSHLPQFREKMAQAYDFALDKVGLDMLSYGVFNDYVQFLKAVPAVGTFAENQKISAIRKVYLKGIATPLLNIEILWGEYCVFERSVNPTLAEKLIAEKSKDYQNARRVSKSMET